MLFKFGAQVKARISHLQVVNEDGSIDQELGPFDNLIVDSGLAAFPDSFKGDRFLSYLAIGVGDTSPSYSDTSLENEKHREDNTISSGASLPDPGTTPYTTMKYRVFETSKGELDSDTDGTYKEIGLSWAGNVGDPIFSRTLIKDANGDPTSITVNSDQKLRLRYEAYVTLSDDSVTTESVDVTNVGTLSYDKKMQVVENDDGPFNFAFGAAGAIRVQNIDRSSHSWGAIGEDASYTSNSGDAPDTSIESNKVSDGVIEYTNFWGTGEANFTINYMRIFDRFSGSAAELHALMASDSEITKTDNDELTLKYEVTTTRA